MTFLRQKPALIDHPWTEPPARGQMIEVAPGVHWLRFPLPISLDHINLWLLDDGDSWTLVDTGFGDDVTQTLWREVLAGAAGDKPLGRLFCTHHHPDHYGQAGWMTEEFNIPLLMTEKEWLVGTLLVRLGDDVFNEGQDAFYALNGLPKDIRARVSVVGNQYRTALSNPPRSLSRVRDNDVLTIGNHDWQVLALEGHSEQLAGLYSPSLRVFIPGDQVLPGISPNISVHWFKDGTEPLGDYLESLERIADMMPADTLVLPSHKLPFVGLHTRIGELQDHHRDRLQGLVDAMEADGPQDAWQLMPAVFPRAISEDHIMFALGESVAHLNHLVATGRAECAVENGRRIYWNS
ncbi:MAG: MBL fold metallo-hydrolase [Alphaproteobacteria bacterium]